MKIRYLGTAAAEGIPAMFCRCETCEKSRKLGGKSIRTRSQAIIDDTLLIDFPADTYMHYLQGWMNLPEIEHCLITHSHSDHLYPEDLVMRKNFYAHPFDRPCLTLYGTRASARGVWEYLCTEDLIEQNCVKWEKIVPFQTFEAGSYTVTPLKADHAPALDAVFYIIEKEGKSLLYANDTGYFPEDTWKYLEEHKPYFNMISLDCTEPDRQLERGHMSLYIDNRVAERLREIGCIDDKTILYCNHFSHNGHMTHPEIEELAKTYGFSVSYDGLEVEF